GTGRCGIELPVLAYPAGRQSECCWYHDHPRPQTNYDSRRDAAGIRLPARYTNMDSAGYGQSQPDAASPDHGDTTDFYDRAAESAGQLGATYIGDGAVDALD